MSDAQGQQEFTTPGTFEWECPAGVTSVCVACVGGGAGYKHTSNAPAGEGGGGGGLGWTNDIPVFPGQKYVVVVGEGGLFQDLNTSTDRSGKASYFIDKKRSAVKELLIGPVALTREMAVALVATAATGNILAAVALPDGVVQEVTAVTVLPAQAVTREPTVTAADLEVAAPVGTQVAAAVSFLEEKAPEETRETDQPITMQTAGAVDLAAALAPTGQKQEEVAGMAAVPAEQKDLTPCRTT